MGKPFEITYRPDSWSAPQGAAATAWTTPYGGLHVQAPANMIGPQFTPAMSNFMFRNAELTSRPAFKQLLPGPDGTNIILGCGSFLSAQQVWHTFCFTPRGLFQLLTNSQALAANGTNPWVYLGGPPLTTAPVAWRAFAGILYYTNGTHLCAWDGTFATAVSDCAFQGFAPTQDVLGGTFIGELDSHIILAYINHSRLGRITNRVQWSNNGFTPIGGTVATVWAAGNPQNGGDRIVDNNGNVQVATTAGNTGGIVPVWSRTYVGLTTDNAVVWANMGPNSAFPSNLGTVGATFDVGVNVNAGVNDFIDCPDIITGLMTLGRKGYVFRQDGITELTATGRGIAPFDFNHLWASQNGIGNVYPFTIAQYGNMGIFISFEQLYQITPGGMQAIGAGARDAILADLAMSTGSPKASIDRGFSLGFTYLNYHLRIPLRDGTRSYVWSVEDQNWASWFESGVWPTGTPNECWV